MKILLQKVVQLIVKQEGTGLQRRDIADQEDNYVCTRSCVEYKQVNSLLFNKTLIRI